MDTETFMQIFKQETYLGDAVYACFDGYHVILRAIRDGVNQFVYLEPNVFNALVKYRENVYNHAKEFIKENINDT